MDLLLYAGLGLLGFELFSSSGGDAQIESLDLAGTKTTGIKGACYVLRAQFGSQISFISGHRTAQSQVNAMAPHIVTSRTWISDTYKTSAIATVMQAWVTANASATTATQIAAGLLTVLNGYPSSQWSELSLHLTDPAQAVDMSPTNNTSIQTACQAIATSLGSSVATFLNSEGGQPACHLQIHGTPAIPTQQQTNS